MTMRSLKINALAYKSGRVRPDLFVFGLFFFSFSLDLILQMPKHGQTKKYSLDTFLGFGCAL